MTVHVAMREWQRAGPHRFPELGGVDLGDDGVRTIARRLSETQRLTVRELRSGLEIETRQWVGRVELGPLTLSVTPKVAPAVLLRLFRYAVGLPALDRSTDVPLDPGAALQDLLAEELARLVEELLRRGISRRYQPRREHLGSPRGRLDMSELARRPLTSGALPCRFFDRNADWDANRALLAGARMAARLTSDPTVRTRLRRVAAQLAVGVTAVELHDRWLTDVRRGLDRLLVGYEAPLALIQLLFRGGGIHLGALEDEDPIRIPGFLFDMNKLFERLLERFLGEHLPDFDVRSQHSLSHLYEHPPGGNPKNRRRPDPRPDFVLVREGRFHAVLDAKYRDLWNRALPREMLYQLSLYALALPACRDAIILYPTVQPEARDAELRLQAATGRTARIVTRPVQLDLIDRALDARSTRPARRLAGDLVNLDRAPSVENVDRWLRSSTWGG